MNFAGKYLQKNNLIIPNISSFPEPGLNIIVVIPCYNEPDLIKSLNSLWSCKRPACRAEVIVVVNSEENASKEVIFQNNKTIDDFNHWRSNHSDESLKFYIFNKTNLPKKFAGVGLARKIGMDEAVTRFDQIKNPGGIIAGFDADCSCDPEYLTEIEEHFIKFPSSNACSIYFEHPVEGNEFDGEIYSSIVQYELFLRYYYEGLKYSGYPYPYNTIGSAFVVKASAYIKQGGMNKRKAGEDFYFLQKIYQLGNFHEINSTKVIPSPRMSLRVPFGTGASISKISSQETKILYSYHPDAFYDLKSFFDLASSFFKTGKEFYTERINSLPLSIRSYLLQTDFYEIIGEINNNCSSPFSFKKKFYNKFNGLTILKFMNFSHKGFYSRIPVKEAANGLLHKIRPGMVNISSEMILLDIFRKQARSAR